MEISSKISKILVLLSGIPRKKLCFFCLFFLGSMPISLSRKHITLLYSKDYFIFEKSDGIRGILVWFKKKIYILDRKLVLNKIIKTKVG